MRSTTTCGPGDAISRVAPVSDRVAAACSVGAEGYRRLADVLSGEVAHEHRRAVLERGRVRQVVLAAGLRLRLAVATKLAT